MLKRRGNADFIHISGYASVALLMAAMLRRVIGNIGYDIIVVFVASVFVYYVISSLEYTGIARKVIVCTFTTVAVMFAISTMTFIANALEALGIDAKLMTLSLMIVTIMLFTVAYALELLE